MKNLLLHITQALFFLLVPLTASSAGASRTVQVGNGTLLNQGLPIINWWLDTYQGTEVLYFADELGLQAGDRITALSYQCAQGSAYGGTFNVRIANTSLRQMGELVGATFDAHDPSLLYVPGTVAVAGTTTLAPYSAGEWVTLELATPFVYEGGNIIVDVRNATPAQAAGWCYFACSNDPNNRCRHRTWINALDEPVSGFYNDSSGSGFFGNDDDHGRMFPNTRFTVVPAGSGDPGDGEWVTLRPGFNKTAMFKRLRVKPSGGGLGAEASVYFSPFPKAWGDPYCGLNTCTGWLYDADGQMSSVAQAGQAVGDGWYEVEYPVYLHLHSAQPGVEWNAVKVLVAYPGATSCDVTGDGQVDIEDVNRVVNEILTQ